MKSIGEMWSNYRDQMGLANRNLYTTEQVIDIRRAFYGAAREMLTAWDGIGEFDVAGRHKHSRALRDEISRFANEVGTETELASL